MPERSSPFGQSARSLVDLALGRRCIDCGAAGVAWCDACLRGVVGVQVGTTPAGTVVTSGAKYVDSVRQAVVAHKELGHLALVTPLARLLATGWVQQLPQRPEVLVPVPSRRAVVRSRGHDHSARLARRAAQVVGGTARSASVLRWTRRVADQAELSVAERLANVSGGMSARSPRGGQAIACVIDDVMTSGATLDEAARALMASGWTVHRAAVVARVERIHPRALSAIAVSQSPR